MDHDNHDDMSHDHNAGGENQSQSGRRLEGVSFNREQNGTGGADTLQAGEIFRADLQALNNSGVGGFVELARQGDRLTVRVQAEGLEANQTHVQHIHGRVGGNGEARDSNVPSEAFDTDRDGFVELDEGLPSYGPILLNLASPQGAGAPASRPRRTAGWTSRKPTTFPAPPASVRASAPLTSCLSNCASTSSTA